MIFQCFFYSALNFSHLSSQYCHIWDYNALNTGVFLSYLPAVGDATSHTRCIRDIHAYRRAWTRSQKPPHHQEITPTSAKHLDTLRPAPASLPHPSFIHLKMDLKAESEDMDYKRPAPIEVFARRSTLHGISHMFTYERMCIKRTLWILFFLGSVGVLVLVCVDRVQFYFQYPHVTKLDEVAASMMVFPSVTFCNLNSFRFSRVTRNDLYHAGELLALLNGRCVSGSGRVHPVCHGAARIDALFGWVWCQRQAWE